MGKREPIGSMDDFAASLDEPEFTEDMLAIEFAAEHQDAMRFVDAWSKWLQWDGSKWRLDATRNVFTLSRAICRAAGAGAKKSVKAALGKARTVAAVETLSRCDDHLKATVDQWDATESALNAAGERVDSKRRGKTQ